jgi:hypothetical protein
MGYFSLNKLTGNISKFMYLGVLVGISCFSYIYLDMQEPLTESIQSVSFIQTTCDNDSSGVIELVAKALGVFLGFI